MFGRLGNFLQRLPRLEKETHVSTVLFGTGDVSFDLQWDVLPTGRSNYSAIFKEVCLPLGIPL